MDIIERYHMSISPYYVHIAVDGYCAMTISRTGFLPYHVALLLIKNYLWKIISVFLVMKSLFSHLIDAEVEGLGSG